MLSTISKRKRKWNKIFLLDRARAENTIVFAAWYVGAW